jgi:PadR family transcriptional regulator, regulatory protein PadR
MLGKDLIAASSKPMVLSILADGKAYGYEIIQRVRELSGGHIEWSEGTLYPLLHRLEREGLVGSEWREAETGRTRKYYFLKGEGRKTLKGEQQNWMRVHDTLCKLWKLEPVSI